MKIICPDCSFTRDVPRENLPDHTVIANCPRCGCRFRFSPDEGFIEKVQDGKLDTDLEPEDEDVSSENTQRSDDPLPEGAIIVNPNRRDEDEQKGSKQKSHSKKEKKAKSFSSLSSRFGELGNPWESAPGEIGWLASWYQTVFSIMFAAPKFFSQIKEDILYRPLFFAIIISLFDFFANVLWMHVLKYMIGDSADADLSAFLALFSPNGNFFLMLLFQIAVGVVKLYLVTALFAGVFRLILGRAVSYSQVFQVVAYSCAPTILAVVPLLGFLIGYIWSICCLIVGLRQVLQLSWSQTILGFLPLLILYALCMRFFTIL